MSSHISARAQQVLKEDIEQTLALAHNATKSRSYLYPFKGMLYFLTHTELWKPLRSKLIPYLTLYSGVLGSMFAVTYIPQLTLMAFVNGPFAVFTTAFLVVSESSTIVNLLARNYLLRDAIFDTFDGTLLSRNAGYLVAQGREVKTHGDVIERLGKMLRKPFTSFGINDLIRYLMYLPLNIVPVIGTVAFLFLRGRARAAHVHERYFQLKGWSISKREKWLKDHDGPYTAFGIVATVLEEVPLASILFSFTNTVGAALWAADIEAQETSPIENIASRLLGAQGAK